MKTLIFQKKKAFFEEKLKENIKNLKKTLENIKTIRYVKQNVT